MTNKAEDTGPPSVITYTGGKQIDISVNKGDLGEKYFLLDGWSNAYNRPLAALRVRSLKNNWRPDYSGMVTLLINEKGDRLYIIDGQHRIAACSLLEGTHVLRAQVYQTHEIPTEEVYEWVIALNLSQATPSINDFLYMAQCFSRWPRLFKEAKEAASYRSSDTLLRWSVLIHAYDHAKKLRSAKMVVPYKTPKVDLALALWKTDDEEIVREMVRFVEWWGPFLKSAKVHRVTGFGSAAVASIALTIFRENQHNPRLASAVDRIFASPNTRAVRSLTGRKLEDLTFARDTLLNGFNYKLNRNHLLTCQGLTGRG